MTIDSLRRAAVAAADPAAPIAATLRHHGDEHHARAVEEMERQRSVAITERGAALSRVQAVLARLGVQDGDADPIRALESWAEEQHARDLTATDERNRFINANAELGLLAVLLARLGGMLPAEGSGPTPWQASVEHEGGMGGVPVIAGNARATAAEAVASLREELEAAEDDGGADDGSVE